MKKKLNLTTHEFLTMHFPGISKKDIIILSLKPSETRKLQDRFCYVHAKINTSKIFSTIQHIKLEKAIHNRLGLFTIEYVEECFDISIYDRMTQEAIYQKELFRYLKASSIIVKRREQINFFLNYSFSRSFDFYRINVPGATDA
jgi:hypothetical protein